MPNHSSLFPRSFFKDYPQAVRGEGCWIYAADGKKYLDAAGQAAVVSIGHGVRSVAQAMAKQAEELALAHTSQFHTPQGERLAERLLALAPAGLREGGRVYFTSGGSEANETAIKLARQFQVERGESGRFRIVSRRQSYHGSTLGAMALSGNMARRAAYQPLLPEWGHINPCFCFHCPLNLERLKSHPHVGDVRGMGLLAAIEFVKAKKTREPFPRESDIADRMRQLAMQRGILTYPGQGCVDGVRGDHLLLAPPFIITAEESRQIANAIAAAADKVFRS